MEASFKLQLAPNHDLRDHANTLQPTSKKASNLACLGQADARFADVPSWLPIDSYRVRNCRFTSASDRGICQPAAAKCLVTRIYGYTFLVDSLLPRA
jgi:hypothetical protein